MSVATVAPEIAFPVFALVTYPLMKPVYPVDGVGVGDTAGVGVVPGVGVGVGDVTDVVANDFSLPYDVPALFSATSL